VMATPHGLPSALVAAMATRPAAPATTASRRAALPPPMSAEDGAKTTLLVALEPDLADLSGAYFSEERLEELEPIACDDEAARRLWQVSEALIDQASSAGT